MAVASGNLLLVMPAGHPEVKVNSTAVSSWNFDAMNVLSWAEEAGVGSAWLQFMALPAGPIFLGTLKTAESPEDEGVLLPHVSLSHNSHSVAEITSHAGRSAV